MNYDRLYILRSKFPRAAMELDLVSGRIDPETGQPNPDYNPDDLQDEMEYNVLQVLDLIDEQGHSGFSHGYLTSLLIPLLRDKPITPLTGKEWEWNGDQNKRCSAVFRNPDGTAHFINGFAFSDDGVSYYTSRESHKTIEFPCASKELETQYINLAEQNNALEGQITMEGFYEDL